MNKNIKLLKEANFDLKQSILNHDLFKRKLSIKDIQLFMENHVYLVWDFMNITARIEASLLPRTKFWLPHNNAYHRSFIRQILIGEDSDHIGDIYISHFELYLQAMKQASANTTSIDTFINSIRKNQNLSLAYKDAKVPEPALKFMKHTFSCLNAYSLEEIVAMFTFGRENLIPDMFQVMLNTLDNNSLSKFILYLERHIELDSGEHEPMALDLLSDLCKDDQTLWQKASIATKTSLEARKQFLDDVLIKMQQG